MSYQTLAEPKYDCAEALERFPGILEDVAKGASFMLVNAGRDFIKFVRLDSPPLMVAPVKKIKRTGFMKGEGCVPKDFDTMCADEILEMFGFNWKTVKIQASKKISIKDARGIFKDLQGMDTTIKRE